MRKILVITLALMFALSGLAFAETWYDSNDKQLGQFTDVKCSTGVTCAQTSGKMVVSFATSFPSTLGSNAVDVANSVWGVSDGIAFEGATADAYETTLTVTDPTADRTITFPDRTGTVRVSTAASVITAGATPTVDLSSATIFTDTPTDNQDQTITATGAATIPGAVATILFITQGTADEVITFGTGFGTTGTLTLSATAARYYTVSFISNGTSWYEISRTAIQTVS